MDDLFTLAEARRRNIFEEAGSRLGLPVASIEKDWWVTVVLETLFTSPEVGPRITFKGGTSLSKAFDLIQRFSEDIDLVVDRKSLGIPEGHAPENATSNKQKKQRVKKIKHACIECIQGEILPALIAGLEKRGYLGLSRVELDPEDADHHRILVAYQSLFPSVAAPYVSAQVKVELESRSEDEPSLTRQIRSLASQAFPEAGWAHEVTVKALDPARTFLEKVCLLHEENCRPPDRTIKGSMSRHIYDLYSLMTADIGKRALADHALLERVLSNRRTYFEYTWMDYDRMQPGSFRLVPADDRIDFWREDYRKLRESMVFGTVPERVGRDAGRIAEEIISHLAVRGDAIVKITLEIEAKLPAGASDSLVRTVTENAHTLKFKEQGFERE